MHNRRVQHIHRFRLRASAVSFADGVHCARSHALYNLTAGRPFKLKRRLPFTRRWCVPVIMTVREFV